MLQEDDLGGYAQTFLVLDIEDEEDRARTAGASDREQQEAVMFQ